MRQHWDSWITRDDFYQIRAAGLSESDLAIINEDGMKDYDGEVRAGVMVASVMPCDLRCDRRRRSSRPGSNLSSTYT